MVPDALIGETGTLASYRFFFDVVPESAIQGTDNKAQVWIGERGNQYGAKPGEQSGKLPLLSNVIPSLENDYNILMHPWKMISPSNIHILRKMR